MKSFELSSKSWHYRIVSKYSNCDEWRLECGLVDFCAYLRHLVVGILWIMVLIVVWSALSALMLLIPGIYLVSLFDIGLHAPDAMLWLVALLWSLIAFGFYAAWCDHNDKPIKFQFLKPDREPGFWTLGYRKFKEKTCFKIEVV